jgi:integrase
MATTAATTTAAILDGVAQSTRKTYETGFVHYENFCRGNGAPLFPATPAVLTAFLVDTMNKRKTYGSVTSAAAAVGFAHRACGFPPIAEGQWRLVLKGAQNQLQKTVVRRQVLTPQMVAEVMDYTQSDDQDQDQIQRGICIALGYFAGARFSDLDAILMKDITFDDSGAHITPTGKRKNDGTNKKSEHRRNLFAARVGGKNCIVHTIEKHAKQFGWGGDKKMMPSKYAGYLRQYRGILRAACNISAEQAMRYGTHSGRRTAASVSRANGDSPAALRAFAGVTSTSWDDSYADSLVPQEREDVASTLAHAVKYQGSANGGKTRKPTKKITKALRTKARRSGNQTTKNEEKSARNAARRKPKAGSAGPRCEKPTLTSAARHKPKTGSAGPRRR